MEDIRRVARAAYENFTEEEKREMESLFRSMDKDGDGKIDLREFMAHSDQHTKSFFSLLDQNDDGFLRFDELLTLGYIASSGMPFCAACKDFIPALFFSCTQCRLASTTESNTYNLCIPCYQGRRFEHEHTDFDDNYTLLLKLQATRSSRAQPSPSSQSSSKTKPSQSDQSCQRRQTRMKEAMKKTLRRIAGVASDVAEIGINVSLMSSIFPTMNGAEGGGGGEGGDDYDAADAADAEDPSDF